MILYVHFRGFVAIVTFYHSTLFKIYKHFQLWLFLDDSIEMPFCFCIQLNKFFHFNNILQKSTEGFYWFQPPLIDILRPFSIHNKGSLAFRQNSYRRKSFRWKSLKFILIFTSKKPFPRPKLPSFHKYFAN